MTEKASGDIADLFAAMADIDLRDLPWMPVDVIRLRDSSMAARASGEEFMAAVLLWAACWHQVPAASLPDDDRELARLAGYGRDVASWEAVKAMALHGFEVGPDKRLYHPVIAEKALQARDSLSANATKRAQGRRRTKEWRERQRESGEGSPSGGGDAGVTRHGDNAVTQCDATRVQDITEHNSPLSSPPKKSGGRRNRGEEMPEDWDPGPEGREFAKELGLDPDRTLARFRDHVAAAPGSRARSRDWSARWREWCSGAPKPRGGKPRTEALGGGRESQWDARAAGYAKGRKYWPADWGAPPGKPGCECPPHILRKHGLEPAPAH